MSVCGRHCSWLGCPRQHGLQFGVGDPEVAQGVVGVYRAQGLGAALSEQFKHADQHAVVAQRSFFVDEPMQRLQLRGLVARQRMLAAVALVGAAGLAADFDGGLNPRFRAGRHAGQPGL